MVYSAILLARWYQIPIVISYHTHLPVYLQTYLPIYCQAWATWILWKYLCILHSFADLSLVTSPQIQEEFAQHGIQRTRVWRKGIDTRDRFHPRHASADMRKRLSDGHPDHFILLYVGRLAREKRLSDLKMALQSMKNTCLALVGEGPWEDTLRADFAGLPVHFVGKLAGIELSQAFASADAFVIPSDSETLGLVVLEAQASGVPVVAARAGGIIDLIEHGSTGYLVEPGDVDEYTDRLTFLQSHEKDRKAMGGRGRQSTLSLSWEASMDELRNDFYAEAVDNCARRHERRLWLLW
jgi:sulfoquinovosyltransferase